MLESNICITGPVIYLLFRFALYLRWAAPDKDGEAAQVYGQDDQDDSGHT